MFKPGDRVRRKKEYARQGFWTQAEYGLAILTVKTCTQSLVYFTKDSLDMENFEHKCFMTSRFELVNTKRLLRR